MEAELNTEELPEKVLGGLTQHQFFNRFIFLSLAVHAGVILVLLIKSVVAPSTRKEYLPSLRVDLVALPDRKANEVLPLPAPSVAEPAPPAKAEEKKLEIKPEDEGEISIPKKKKHEKPTKKENEAQAKLKNALARIKALERVKALQQGEQIKGNQISKGSALSGEAKASLETTYFDVVLERVRSYWELPKWLLDQNLSAKVLIYINRKGEIRSYEFIKSSGNEQFDSEVKRTLKISSPFPVPPEPIAGDLSNDGILLGFPL